MKKEPNKNSNNYRYLFLAFLLCILFWAGSFMYSNEDKSVSQPDAKQNIPSEQIEKKEAKTDNRFVHPRLRGLDEWKRPEGPLRVALQVGHWKAEEAPDELKRLRVNTGASRAGIAEWEVALSIAQETKTILERENVLVEILPTTIPPNYWADVFISIHADGNNNSYVSGYKVASPWRDYSRKSGQLATLLETEYGLASKLSIDPNITRAMRGYYAFNWRRYDHSIHPMTTAAIIETGFLTNVNDRRLMVNTPEIPANGIANGILKFLNVKNETAQKDLDEQEKSVL